MKTQHTSALYAVRTHHYFPFLRVLNPDEIKTDLIKVWQYIKMVKAIYIKAVIAPVDHNSRYR